MKKINYQFRFKHLMVSFSAIVLLSIQNTFGQTLNIQTLESFDYADNTTLDGQNGGWGWMGPWVASDATAVSSYIINAASTGAFSYANPASSAYYITPGRLSGANTAGKIIGRYLDTSPTGPYRSTLDANGSLGTSNGFVGFLLRKTTDDDTQVYFGLSNGLSTDNINSGISIGYFGPIRSNAGGKRYWTIKWSDGTYVNTYKEIVINKDEFFVFAMGDYYSDVDKTACYLNSDPVIQNANGATALTQKAVPLRFKSVFFYSEGGGVVDEIRINRTIGDFLIYNPTTSQPLTGVNATGPGVPGAPLVTPDNNKWKLDGNSGTDPAYQFIGNTDAQDLKIRTNNVERVTVTKDGNVGIGIGTPLRPIHIKSETATLRLERTSNTTSASYMGIDYVPAGAASSANVTWGTGIEPSSNNYAVWSYDGSANADRFIIAGNGNIGIGTPNPGQKLDVTGNIVADGIALSRNNTNRGALWFANYGDYNHSMYNNQGNIDGEGIWDGFKLNVFDGLNVRVRGQSNASSTVSALYIDGNGNTGIGTTTPTQKLEVAGTAKVNTLMFSDGTFMTTSGASFSSSNLTLSPLSSTDNNAYISTNGVGTGLIFETPDAGTSIGVPRMSITNNGSIGIGTTTPDAALHVVGDIFMSKANSPAYSTGYSSKLKFDDGDMEGTDPLWIARYNTAYNQSELRINIGDDPADASIMDKLVIGNTVGSNWTAVLTVNSNGEINTSSHIRIGGKVLSQDVKVVSNPLSADFPDYVFKKGYKLETLSDIEAYIKENGHLKEVPSAKEVQEDGGFELGKMNVLLLKKVEELTLYSIDLNKNVELLKKMLKGQQDEINTLKKRK